MAFDKVPHKRLAHKVKYGEQSNLALKIDFDLITRAMSQKKGLDPNHHRLLSSRDAA